MNLEGRRIVVTGAASGIGAETARCISDLGARVIGVDLHEPAGADRFVRADLADRASIDAAIDAIGPGIDGLCNIAGLPPTHPEDQVLLVNFVGLRHLTLGMVRHFNEGASIVNVASLAANGWVDAVPDINEFLAGVDFGNVAGFVREHGIEGARSYFFSKELVVAWTMLNRWTWRHRGIRMNCVSPGPVTTPIYPDFQAAMADRAGTAERHMDRVGRTADVAPVVAFMLSDASAWIRGANLPCDGGMHAHYAQQRHGLRAGDA